MSQNKQPWDYIILEKVKYATSKYFKTIKDNPRIDGLNSSEVEACYATGIQWIELAVPIRRRVDQIEAAQMLMVMSAVIEYKAEVVDCEGVRNRDLKMFGLSANELHRIIFSNVDGELYEQLLEEYYWCNEMTLLKTSGMSDGLQGLWYKTMAASLDNYVKLRAVDGLFSWAFTLALCCNTDEKISKLPEWHYECVDIIVWYYDATVASKHRAEVEPCDLSRYIDDGMPESVSNMLEYSRERIWQLNKTYNTDQMYLPYRTTMQSTPGWGLLMYRYRHIDILGPILAKNTENDDKIINDGKHVWYKITQDGGPVGVIRKYRELSKMKKIGEKERSLNKNRDLECKRVMRKVLSEDVEKYNEIDFPIAKDMSVKI